MALMVGKSCRQPPHRCTTDTVPYFIFLEQCEEKVFVVQCDTENEEPNNMGSTSFLLILSNDQVWVSDEFRRKKVK